MPLTVHHFLARHELQTADGCVAARRALTSALDRITLSFADLQTWAKDMEQTRKILADHLASSDVRDLIVHDHVPWHIMAIVQALHEAAMDLTRGDWVPVDAATRWIAERDPEEKPESYGCRTWRQLIHETGCFDQQVRKVDGRRQAWYRPCNRESRRP